MIIKLDIYGDSGIHKFWQ